jgi:hypothetical protein
MALLRIYHTPMLLGITGEKKEVWGSQGPHDSVERFWERTCLKLAMGSPVWKRMLWFQVPRRVLEMG